MTFSLDKDSSVVIILSKLLEIKKTRTFNFRNKIQTNEICLDEFMRYEIRIVLIIKFIPRPKETVALFEYLIYTFLLSHSNILLYIFYVGRL